MSKGDRPVAIPARELTGTFRVLRATVVPLLWLFVGMRREGTHHLPREGAFVLSPNHTSNLDPVIMGVATFRAGRTPHFLAKASVFRVPLVGPLLRTIRQIPVERGGSARGNNPLDAAALVAASGSGVIVYPEGTLTRDPDLWPMRGKTGAVRIALAAGVPLIPVAHWGTERLLGPYARFPRLIPRVTITIRYGAPVDLSEFADHPLDAATLTAATEKVMTAITALVAELRQETPPATRWDPAEHNQSEFGRP